MGAYFAYESGLRENPEVTNAELIDFIGKTKHTINPRLSELKKEKKLISVTQGLYKIKAFDIVEEVEDILFIVEKSKNE